jgi:capsular polysaccharide biosynthesis protein
MAMGFQMFVKAMLRNWPLLVLATALTAGSTAFFALRREPVYRAAATLEFKPNPALTATNQINDALDALSKRGTLNTIARKVGLGSTIAAIAERLQIAPDQVRKASLDATVPPDTNLIEVRAQSTNPDLAAAIANTAAEILRGQNPERLLVSQVVDPAVSPAVPIDPPASRLIALGALFGLALGVIFALLSYTIQPIVLAMREQRRDLVPAAALGEAGGPPNDLLPTGEPRATSALDDTPWAAASALATIEDSPAAAEDVPLVAAEPAVGAATNGLEQEYVAVERAVGETTNGLEHEPHLDDEIDALADSPVMRPANGVYAYNDGQSHREDERYSGE